MKAGGNSHISRRELFTPVCYSLFYFILSYKNNLLKKFLFIKIFYKNFNLYIFQVDSYYSLAYPSPRGNLRSWFKTIPAGEPLDSVVAKFRLKMRCEVQINWHLLTLNAIYFVIGKFII